MGLRELNRQKTIVEVECPSGLKVRVRRLNALAITNIMKGFPALLGTPDEAAPQAPKGKRFVSMDELIEGATYQRTLIMLAVVSPKIVAEEDSTEEDAIPFVELDGEDVSTLVGIIEGRTELKGGPAEEAAAFRPGSGPVPVD